MPYLDIRLLTWAAIAAIVIVVVCVVIGTAIGQCVKASTWFQRAGVVAMVLAAVTGLGQVASLQIPDSRGGSAVHGAYVGTLVSHGRETEVALATWRMVLFVEYLGYFLLIPLGLSVSFLFHAMWLHARRLQRPRA